jgi:hypothetical protein
MPGVERDSLFSIGGASSMTVGTVLLRSGCSVAVEVSVDVRSDEPALDRGADGREKTVAPKLPVAAQKPSGISDCSKLWEARRRRPLRDEEAAGRFTIGVEGEGDG